jgi:hypothetical protein
LSIFTATARDEHNHHVHDAMMRMQAAATPASKLLWARRMNQARRDRGDFDHLVTARREHLDQEGERHD